MILDNITFADLCEHIGPISVEWQGQVVPAEVEPLPHSAYSPEYSWMYAFEKRTKYHLEERLQSPLGKLEKRLFGADGVFSESLSNAFVHGHRRDPTRPITVRWSASPSGLVFSVQDTGPGFDISETVRRVQAGGAYANYGGNGLKALEQADKVTACFADRGRRVMVCIQAEQPMEPRNEG